MREAELLREIMSWHADPWPLRTLSCFDSTQLLRDCNQNSTNICLKVDLLILASQIHVDGNIDAQQKKTQAPPFNQRQPAPIGIKPSSHVFYRKHKHPHNSETNSILPSYNNISARTTLQHILWKSAWSNPDDTRRLFFAS